MDVNLSESSLGASAFGISDEERIAILADLILEAINLEEQT